MSQSEWYVAVKELGRYVVKIETPDGHGSGFLVPAPAGKKSIKCIATALHVIQHARDWQEPIRVIHPESGQEILLDAVDRPSILCCDITKRKPKS